MAQTPSTSGGRSDYHVPVMVAEVVELMAPLATGVVVDATYGGGGHSAALLAALPGIRILALDRDTDAIVRVPVDTRVLPVAANYENLAAVLTDPATEAWLHESAPHDQDRVGVAGVLFDLGVSSHQLDRAARGFSFHQAGPLDMRMGPDARHTAEEIVNTWPADELTRIFRRYGEERFARRIADGIVRHRPFTDTRQLAETIAEAVPAPARRGRHPARRVFQAIRIAVNDELDAVARGLDSAIDHLRPGGRVIVIAYHSLEDRIVKRRFVAGATGCDCPPDMPVCMCGKTPELRRLTRKAMRPTEAEILANPRARSARLRGAEKVSV